MPFPTTLPDTTHFWQSGQGRNRPWISSGGNVYFVTGDGTTPDLLVVKKATDPSDSFSEVATLTITGAASQISCLTTIQDGDNLHIVTAGQAANGDKTFRYSVFSMASDTFTISDEDTTISALGNNAPTASTVIVDMEIRSDSDIILNYTGTRENIMGTRYHRVYYARREGTTWTVDISLDAGGQFHYLSCGIVRGASDLMHLTWIKLGVSGPTSDVEHRSLTSGNSLSSVQTVNDTLARDDAGADHIVAAPVFYDSGGTERITVAWDDDTANHGFTSEIDDDGTPGAEEDATDNPVHLNTSNGRVSTMSLAVDEEDVHVLYSQESDEDIFSDVNSNGGGWGTDVEERDGVDCIVLTTNIYQRGDDIVLAFVYANTNVSAVRYDEIVIRSTGVQIDKEASDTLGLEINEAVSDLLGVIDVLDSLDLSISEVTEILGFLERVDTVGISLGEAVNLLAILERIDTLDLAITDASALVVVQTAIDTLNLAIIEGVTNLLGKIDPVDTLDLDLIEPTPEGESEGTAQDDLDLEVNEAVADLLGRSSDQDVIDLEVIEGPGGVAAGITAEDDVDLDLIEGVTDLLGLIAPVDTTGLTVDEVQQILSLAERLDTLGISISEVTDLLGIISRTDLLDLSIEEILAQVAVMVAGSDTLDLTITEGVSQVLVGVQVSDTLDLAVVELTDLLGLIAGSDTVGLTIIEGVTFLFVRLDRTDTLDVDLGEVSDLEIFGVAIPIVASDTLDVAVVESVSQLTAFIQSTDLLDLSIDEISQVVGFLNRTDILDLDLGQPEDLVVFIQVADQLDIDLLDVADLINVVQAADTLNVSISEVSQVFNALSVLDTLDIDLTEDPGDVVSDFVFEGILVQPFTLQVLKVARFTLQVDNPTKQFTLQTTRVARFTLQIEGSGEQRP